MVREAGAAMRARGVTLAWSKSRRIKRNPALGVKHRRGVPPCRSSHHIVAAWVLGGRGGGGERYSIACQHRSSHRRRSRRVCGRWRRRAVAGFSRKNIFAVAAECARQRHRVARKAAWHGVKASRRRC